jgi:hypothetical protein
VPGDRRRHQAAGERHRRQARNLPNASRPPAATFSPPSANATCLVVTPLGSHWPGRRPRVRRRDLGRRMAQRVEAACHEHRRKHGTSEGTNHGHSSILPVVRAGDPCKGGLRVRSEPRSPRRPATRSVPVRGAELPRASDVATAPAQGTDSNASLRSATRAFAAQRTRVRTSARRRRPLPPRPSYTPDRIPIPTDAVVARKSASPDVYCPAHRVSLVVPPRTAYVGLSRLRACFIRRECGKDAARQAPAA